MGYVSSSKELFSSQNGYFQPIFNSLQLLLIIFDSSSLFSTIASNNLSFNAPQIFADINYGIWSVKNENETIIWNLCLMGCYDWRKILAMISCKSYHCPPPPPKKKTFKRASKQEKNIEGFFKPQNHKKKKKDEKISQVQKQSKEFSTNCQNKSWGGSVFKLQ